MEKKSNLSQQIQIFSKDERPIYQSFTKIINWFLEQVKQRVAPLGTVGARPKEVASFAEKILRKPDCDDPVHQFTDLCGGRLIVHTRNEMRAADKFIGACLKIIAREDKLQIAGVNEFGYGSVHLDVAVDDKFEQTLGKLEIAIPDHITKALADIRKPRHDGKPIERKAEIQVRTDLQHVWADTLHDLLYKSGVDMPRILQREANRLSAVLEEASCAIDELVGKLSAYKVDHGAFLSRQQITEETTRLHELLEQDISSKARSGIALRLAKLARSVREWGTVINQEPWIKQAKPPVRNELRYIVAEALCRQNETQPDSEAFKCGMHELKSLAEPIPLSDDGINGIDSLNEISKKLRTGKNNETDGNIRAMAMAELARSVFVRRKGDTYALDARDLYFQAHLLVPCNPYVFTKYLHSYVIAEQSRSIAVFMHAAIDQAIAICKDHAAVGIELPFAHFAEGMLHALSGDINTCLLYCARGIASSNDSRLIEEEISLFKQLQAALSRKDSVYAKKLTLVLQTLALGKAVKMVQDKKGPIVLDSDLVPLDRPAGMPVVIIAGTCDPELEKELDPFRAILDHGLTGFSGSIYCGGTDTGISGIVGNAVDEQRKKGRNISLKSHRPGTLKEDYSKKHPAYEQIVMENAVEFTCAQPIQYWIDLLAAGADPGKIRVLGIGGGMVSLFEYHLAVALGAFVGIINGSGRCGADITGGQSWWNKARTGLCMTLPNDKETVWNFLNIIPGNLGLDEETLKRLEPTARGLHEKYVVNATSTGENKNLLPWDKLPEDLRISTLHQAMQMSRVLAEFNLEIREIESTTAAPIDKLEDVINEEQLEHLAEIEHGRWNAERLLQGWNYGKIKNIDKKISPSLVPWKNVPEKMKKYDRDPFKELPEILKASGLGIYKIR